MTDMTPRFTWYELMTNDPARAQAFYGPVVGWETEDLTGVHAGYSLFKADGRGVAGMLSIPAEACANGATPGWLGYIAVPDVEAEARRIEAAGGRVLLPARDIPQVGRFAVVSDPQGTVFQLLAPLPGGDAPAPAPRMTPGHVGWHELYAEDGDAAFAFYAEHFGWSEVSIFDMGPMGAYRLFADGGQEAVGGMMTKPPQSPSAGWQFYFVVDGIDAAAARITEHGGSVRMGPMEVPDGSFVVMGADPEGVAFALVSKTR